MPVNNQPSVLAPIFMDGTTYEVMPKTFACDEEVFVYFSPNSHGRNFYPMNFSPHVSNSIEPMVTFHMGENLFLHVSVAWF